ncbi:hypothetical protein CVT26_015777 [Gymnopilus dilepis]|uniref:Uncharacterized protein n=1 Tax=Gymnopilus dilepis TaxID=231916 RepID=A0A409W4K4_9AGAR|nr:hypothetical protein CVT26_015777 [Gymnopilus dilepis]
MRQLGETEKLLSLNCVSIIADIGLTPHPRRCSKLQRHPHQSNLRSCLSKVPFRLSENNVHPHQITSLFIYRRPLPLPRELREILLDSSSQEIASSICRLELSISGYPGRLGCNGRFSSLDEACEMIASFFHNIHELIIINSFLSKPITHLTSQSMEIFNTLLLDCLSNLKSLTMVLLRNHLSSNTLNLPTEGQCSTGLSAMYNQTPFRLHPVWTYVKLGASYGDQDSSP